MKIIITASGLSSRFKKMGIYKPSYKIKIKEKTIYEWAMLSLVDFFDEEFIFIFRTDNFDKEFINRVNKKIGIKNYKTYIIDECTDGQATTVFKYKNFINDDEKIIIYNINTCIKPYEIKKEDIKPDIDVFMPIENNNKVYNIIGFFYFKKWKDYKQIYNKYISDIKAKNSEASIEAMYEYLIYENKLVETKIIDSIYVSKLNSINEIQIFKDKFN